MNELNSDETRRATLSRSLDASVSFLLLCLGSPSSCYARLDKVRSRESKLWFKMSLHFSHKRHMATRK